MTTAELIQTHHCKSGAYCGKCRDRKAGRRWRELVAKGCIVPGGVVDFDCPKGKPWGFAPPAPKPIRLDGAPLLRRCAGCGGGESVEDVQQRMAAEYAAAQGDVPPIRPHGRPSIRRPGRPRTRPGP